MSKETFVQLELPFTDDSKPKSKPLEKVEVYTGTECWKTFAFLEGKYFRCGECQKVFITLEDYKQHLGLPVLRSFYVSQGERK